MKRCEFSPAARIDLLELYEYVAEERPLTAARLLQRLERSCRGLARMPGKGRPCEELALGLRSLSVKPYLIFYRITEQGVLIVRVLHGARDIPKFFR